MITKYLPLLTTRDRFVIPLALALATMPALDLSAQAQVKKPATAKPPVTKPAPAKPPVKPANGPIVLGTTQLPGDFGKIGTTYTIGTREPINFTLRSAEYTVAPLVIGNNVWVPRADQKLLVLHYTVHNPLPQEQGYDWSDLRFTVVDALDQNHDMIQVVGRDGTTEKLSIALKPAQKIEVVAAVLIPAEGVVPKLMVEREQGAPIIRYDLREKVTVLPTSMADSTDITGAKALKEVPAQSGTFYSTGVFDTRLDEVSYAPGPIIRREAGNGKRFLNAVFTIKNKTNQEQSYYWANFYVELKDADGEKVEYTQAMLKASRDEVTDGKLAPGEEARVRFFFALPDNVEGKTLRLSEGKAIDVRVARVFAFDVSSASK